MNNLNPFYAFVNRGITLYAKSEDLETINEVLQLGPNKEDQVHCPNCDSIEIIDYNEFKVNKNHIFRAIHNIIFGNYWLLSKPKKFECKDCGWKF